MLETGMGTIFEEGGKISSLKHAFPLVWIACETTDKVEKSIE